MKIKICKSLNTLNKIGSLRYQVYHLEQNKNHLDGLDHELQILTNSKDFQNSIILFIEKGSDVIGTLRFQHVEFGPKLMNKYNIEKSSVPLKYAEVDFFIVDKNHRNSTISSMLACEIYYLALQQRINICLIEIEDFLEKFYQRLGFKLIKRVDYKYGSRSQMSLNLMDINHLLKVRSPFVEYYNKTQKYINESVIKSKTDNEQSVYSRLSN